MESKAIDLHLGVSQSRITATLSALCVYLYVCVYVCMCVCVCAHACVCAVARTAQSLTALINYPAACLAEYNNSKADVILMKVNHQPKQRPASLFSNICCLRIFFEFIHMGLTFCSGSSVLCGYTTDTVILEVWNPGKTTLECYTIGIIVCGEQLREIQRDVLPMVWRALRLNRRWLKKDHVFDKRSNTLYNCPPIIFTDSREVRRPRLWLSLNL